MRGTSGPALGALLFSMAGGAVIASRSTGGHPPILRTCPRTNRGPLIHSAAYMNNEIREFEKVLKQHSASVMGDAFIKLYLDDLLKNIRTQVCLRAPVAPCIE